MFKVLVLLFVLPYVSCDFRGLNIQQGKCPNIQGAVNFNPAQRLAISVEGMVLLETMTGFSTNCLEENHSFNGNFQALHVQEKGLKLNLLENLEIQKAINRGDNVENEITELGNSPLLTAFQGIWTVSQRSDDFFGYGKDCETQSYLFDGNNFHVFVVFSNPDTEKGKAYQARTVNRGVGILGFARSLLSDNLLLKGTQTIVATDNTSFAVTVSCNEILNFRIITISVLIKGINPPANLDQLVNQALANNNLALDPPLRFRDLEARCRI